jgi:hypothetical protein
MQNFITRPFVVLAKKLAIFGMAALLLGCSAARLGYSNGETVSYWWLNSYVDFDDVQKPWVKQHIAELFAWHRSSELKQYVSLLHRAQQRDPAGVSSADLLADYGDARARVLLIAEHAAPDLAELALSLTPQQIANIERKFAKSNAKFRKEYLKGDTAQRQKFRYRKTMTQAEYWFGYFSREQEEEIRAASDARPLNNELRLAARVQWQQELIALLKKIQAEKPEQKAATDMIRKFIAASADRFGNRTQQAFFDESNAATANMVAAIMHMTTRKQKAHFVKTLQDWIDDFKRLSAPAVS